MRVYGHIGWLILLFAGGCQNVFPFPAAPQNCHRDSAASDQRPQTDSRGTDLPRIDTSSQPHQKGLRLDREPGSVLLQNSNSGSLIGLCSLGKGRYLAAWVEATTAMDQIITKVHTAVVKDQRQIQSESLTLDFIPEGMNLKCINEEHAFIFLTVKTETQSYSEGSLHYLVVSAQDQLKMDAPHELKSYCGYFSMALHPDSHLGTETTSKGALACMTLSERISLTTFSFNVEMTITLDNNPFIVSEDSLGNSSPAVAMNESRIITTWERWNNGKRWTWLTSCLNDASASVDCERIRQYETQPSFTTNFRPRIILKGEDILLWWMEGDSPVGSLLTLDNLNLFANQPPVILAPPTPGRNAPVLAATFGADDRVALLWTTSILNDEILLPTLFFESRQRSSLAYESNQADHLGYLPYRYSSPIIIPGDVGFTGLFTVHVPGQEEIYFITLPEPAS